MQAGDPWKGEVAVNAVKAEVTGDGRGEQESLGWNRGTQKLIKYPKPARIPEISDTQKNPPVSQKHV